MDFPSRPAVSCEIPTGLLAALGLEMAEVMREPRDFLIVVNHAAIVENLKPDIAALAKIDMGIGGAIITAAGENDVDYVCRFFAPSEGIDEDPATGSIQCTLVPYWAGRTGKQTFRVQQLSSRGARMWCTLVGDRVKKRSLVKRSFIYKGPSTSNLRSLLLERAPILPGPTIAMSPGSRATRRKVTAQTFRHKLCTYRRPSARSFGAGTSNDSA